jgi:hypothetical protein
MHDQPRKDNHLQRKHTSGAWKLRTELLNRFHEPDPAKTRTAKVQRAILSRPNSVHKSGLKIASAMTKVLIFTRMFEMLRLISETRQAFSSYVTLSRQGAHVLPAPSRSRVAGVLRVQVADHFRFGRRTERIAFKAIGSTEDSRPLYRLEELLYFGYKLI